MLSFGGKFGETISTNNPFASASVYSSCKLVRARGQLNILKEKGAAGPVATLYKTKFHFNPFTEEKII